MYLAVIAWHNLQFLSPSYLLESQGDPQLRDLAVGDGHCPAHD